MRRPIAVAAVIGALAVGGTAMAAAGGGGPFGIGGDPQEHEAELAKDLASKLDGVSAGQVRTALREVHEERHAARRKELAAALAAELDGVSASEVEKALEKTKPSRRSFRARGMGRGPGEHVAALAKELGKTKAEVRKAMRAAHRKLMERKLDEAVKSGRLTEEQADQIRERIKNGPPRFMRRGGRPGAGGPGGPHGFAVPVPPPGE